MAIMAASAGFGNLGLEMGRNDAPMQARPGMMTGTVQLKLR